MKTVGMGRGLICTASGNCDYKTAIDALENQIVKEPKKTAVKTWWGIPYKAWCCPACGTSRFDNGDNYILVRSSSGKGFYRTDDAGTIKAYRQECLNKGKSIFAPIKKIDRVLNANTDQFTFVNNLRIEREAKGMTQTQVCDAMKKFDYQIDKALLSRMENNICLPTPFQLKALAEIYGCNMNDLVNTDLF